MPILLGFLLIAGVIGAIWFGKKKHPIPMVGCIIVALASAFLIVCTIILVSAID